MYSQEFLSFYFFLSMGIITYMVVTDDVNNSVEQRN